MKLGINRYKKTSKKLLKLQKKSCKCIYILKWKKVYKKQTYVQKTDK
ncbi:hypothetical protein HMPREF3195_00841 [Peptostreptococcus anaerobius]|uniref:Uncharacterized protein n=1 Tax=Peptostreptococcus anaerobius TaxID=1261 RepID=A0A135YUY9_9FIRM|nr:hypothetical protein HMPREF3195_00841 [Peptostreptococcus anaerobius]